MIGSLENIGALLVNHKDASHERQMKLTPMGKHLAAIPAPPTVGKLLVMCSLLGCRGSVLAIAAGMSVGRSPFLRIENARRNTPDDNEDAALEEFKMRKILQGKRLYLKASGIATKHFSLRLTSI